MEPDEIMKTYEELLSTLDVFLGHPSNMIKKLSLETMSNVIIAGDTWLWEVFDNLMPRLIQL